MGLHQVVHIVGKSLQMMAAEGNQKAIRTALERSFGNQL
jgi:hypothetical protein